MAANALPAPVSTSGPEYRGLTRFLKGLPALEQRFWILVSLTGVIAGFMAAGLEAFLHLVQRLSWHDPGRIVAAAGRASSGRTVVVPVMAGLLIVAVSLIVGRPLRGHGTAGILEGIWVHSGRVPFGRALLRGTVSIIAVAMGAPLGREGALLSTGAATGSALAQRLRLAPSQVRLLVACGAAAGMSAAYNVPIGGALFGLEVLLGSFALELLGPIVVSCVLATVTSRVLLHASPSYRIPPHDMGRPKDLLVAVAVGVVIGLASALYVRVIDRVAARLERLPQGWTMFLPAVAMTGIGVLALWRPDILGNGYEPVNGALTGALPFALLLGLPFLKLAATAVCSGAGVPGGLFTPSLFYGALLAGALGHAVGLVWPGAPPEGAFALLGMGAVLAGTTHASFSSVLLIFEMTGDYGVIVPLMLTSLIAVAVSRRLQPESLYTAVLVKRQVRLEVAQTPAWVREERLERLVDRAPATIAPSSLIEEVLARFLELAPGQNLYVVDHGRLLGVISLHAIKGLLPHYRSVASGSARQLMEAAKPLRVDASLAEASRAFVGTPLDELPVVGPAGELVGTVRKSDVLSRGRF